MRTQAKLTLSSMVGAALLLFAAAPASAAGVTPGGWEFDIAPYVWLTEIHGDIKGAGGRKVDIDVSFDDVLDDMGAGNLFGIMGHFEAHRDRLGLMFDAIGVYAKDEKGGDLAGTDSTTRIGIFEFGAAYTLLEFGDANKPSLLIDPLVGVRYMHVKADADLRLGAEETSLELTKDLADPFLGMRFIVPLTNELQFSFRGDAGGFGAGTDLSWQIISVFRYRVGQMGSINWDVGAGYRLFDFKKSSDSRRGERELSLQQRGPLVGLAAHF